VRTLWVYGDNPMLTPPVAHADDPLYPYVLAWQGSVSAYGPVFYAMGIPFSWLAGEDLLANVLGLKALNGIGLLLLTWLVAREAERLAPGRGVAAAVAVGWNPFIQYETMTSGHNDVLMMVFAVAALGLVTRVYVSQGLIMLGVSGLVKYTSLILVPLVFLWSWPKASDRERLTVISLAFAGALSSVMIYLIFSDTFRELRDFLTTDRIWKSLAAVITNTFEPSLGLTRAADLGRLVSWGLVATCYLLAVRRLNGSARSLYGASFVALAALAALSRPEFFTWYYIWFIPLGAVLFGDWEWDLSFLASGAALLTYAVFPWSTDTPTTNVLYVLMVLVAPLGLLGALQLWRRQRRPVARPAG
jgi:hypothetical protein